MTAPAPVTTRVGGGFAARAAIVLVALTITGIVGVALANRPPAPPPAAPLVRPSAASTQPGASPSPTEPLFYPSIELGDDAFAAIAFLGRRQYPVLLRPLDEARLAGSMRLPFPGPDVQGTLELAQLWDRGPGRNFQSIGRWSLPLVLLRPDAGTSGTVLTISEAAHPLSAQNRLVRDGFRLELRFESSADFGMIFVTVTTPWCPDLSAGCELEPPERVQIEAADVIVGLPAWPPRSAR